MYATLLDPATVEDWLDAGAVGVTANQFQRYIADKDADLRVGEHYFWKPTPTASGGGSPTWLTSPSQAPWPICSWAGGHRDDHSTTCDRRRVNHPGFGRDLLLGSGDQADQVAQLVQGLVAPTEPHQLLIVGSLLLTTGRRSSAGLPTPADHYRREATLPGALTYQLNAEFCRSCRCEGETEATLTHLHRESNMATVSVTTLSWPTALRHCRSAGTSIRPSIVVRTLFGTLRLASPRWLHCSCAAEPTRTFRPLTVLLPERTTPELVYLESKFAGYIQANTASIPHYGERYRAGDTISSSFVESAVNQVISKLVKKQQMRWTPRGAHLLLHIRTRVLNDDLASDFHQWYPRFTHTAADRQELAA